MIAAKTEKEKNILCNMYLEKHIVAKNAAKAMVKRQRRCTAVMMEIAFALEGMKQE